MIGYLSFLALSATLAGGVGASRLLQPPNTPAREQDDCPALDAFALAEHWSVTLGRLAPQDVWPRVGQALDAWRAAYFPGDTSSLPALVLERGGSIQQKALSLDAHQARTCFFRRRLPPRLEYRLALAFTLQPGERGALALEVRWLSGLKGAGERTWMVERERAGPLVEDLVRRIKGSQP